MSANNLFPAHFKDEMLNVNGVDIHVRHGGEKHKPAMLLLHGYPQTSAIWHKIIPTLLEKFYVVAPDLRGYGQSAKPLGLPDHSNYAKRVMAHDQAEVMTQLGFTQFYLCGHDRGGRVAHRLALDNPTRVHKVMVLDISPTLTMYDKTDFAFAQAYYHWFFLTQPHPLPETLIGANPAFYLLKKTGGWGTQHHAHFTAEAMAEYQRCYADPATIHGSCEDYRAAASIDLEHDRASIQAGHKLQCPLHALWGARGVVAKLFNPITDWQAVSHASVSGKALASGHYIPEEVPELLLQEMQTFFV